MEKSFISNLSRSNKDELKDQNLKDIEANFNSLNLGNSNNDIYYKNKSFVPKNDNNNLNDININSINLNNSQNIRNINLFSNNNNFNNNNNFIGNDFFENQNDIFFNEDNINSLNNINNNNRIINQNCYQINIEKLNIHNQINNINQNYNIGTSNENNNSKISIQSNESFKSKGSLNSNKMNQGINLNYILNNIEKLTENQSGCRLLQNKIQQNPSISNSIYNSIKMKLSLKKLSIDSFGNYLIQKLLEFISEDLVIDFFNTVVCPSFIEIALNPHGSRVIQKLISRIYMHQDIMNIFNQLLQTSMLEIFLNQCSTYIIITYITYIKYPNNQLIYSFIEQNIYYIATHKHSCCTLQKCLEEGNNIQRQGILMSLAYISNQLFADQFGNYAIQYALSLKNETANRIITNQYLNNFKQNISDKISSNVYEKVLEFCDFQTRQNIIKCLCNFETVKSLLYDSYGNYVLQKTILAANEPYRSMYLNFIAPLIDGLKNMPNGYIINHKILNQFPELQSLAQNNNLNKMKNYNINSNTKNYNINNKNYHGKEKKYVNKNNGYNSNYNYKKEE